MYILLFYVHNENKKHPPMCSENQDNIRYALITVVLSYTPRSFDKASTQVCLIRVIRKPSQFFLSTHYLLVAVIL